MQALGYSRIWLLKASVEEIAKEAGISKGSLFYYFKTREISFFIFTNMLHI